MRLRDAQIGLFACVWLAVMAVVPVQARTLRIWGHQGQEGENRAMREIVAAFNAAHASEGLSVEISFFPDFQYTEKIAIAAAAHDLPDAFEVDAPLIARYVDADLLAPLDRWFGPQDQADFLPTLNEQARIGGKLYSVAAFDSALVLYYDRAMLADAGVAPPPAGGWTWDAFLAACAKLKAHGVEPVALHMNESADEWFTYAFTPVIWSGGGALISEDGTQVRGVLASAANVRSLTQWQTLFTRGYAATDPVDPNPFGHGAAAMDWSGHWMAKLHLDAKGDRLGATPLPRTGVKAVAPCGSWCWGMAAQTSAPELAAKWLRWVTSTEHGIVPLARANGAVPSRRSAFAEFPEYRTAPYKLFREQLETIARPRPQTPYYATLTQHFAAALRDIARGADVATRLRTAADEIQREIDRRSARRGGEAAR